MGLFTVVSLVSFFFVYINMTNQILDSNLNSVQISQNQLGYQMSQIDKAFWEYWDSNDAHKILSQIQPETNMPWLKAWLQIGCVLLSTSNKTFRAL